VAWELHQLGIVDAGLQAKGVATAEPVRPEDNEDNRKYNRSATFRVSVVSSSQP
jgi:outer membrane protein OmpA-like peptidoglycan-associated protein